MYSIYYGDIREVKIIIQCASSKQDNGLLGKVNFVAHPENKNEAHPDDLIPNSGQTWRDYVEWENINDYTSNKRGLHKIGELYKPKIYKEALKKFGYENTYILSAGWGLVRSDYLIPNYDITFSSMAEKKYRRKKEDTFKDFNQLAPDEEFTFFGGEAYLPLLYKLINIQQFTISPSEITKPARIIYHASDTEKHLGYTYVKYPRCFTNWHYSALREFIS